MIDTISILRIVESTTVDGPGLRTSIYCAGCVNRCPGCQNRQSWDINNGTPTSIDYILQRIKDDDFANVTFSGGDPMYQALPFAELARRIKAETRKTIWCYSGYTFEEIMADNDKRTLLKYIDVLVDGRYVQELRNTELLFRGSSNQRLIDVQASLAEGKAVTYKYNPFPVFDEMLSVDEECLSSRHSISY